MGSQKFGGMEVFATRMSRASDKAHVLCHCAVGGFALHGAARIVRSPTPLRNSARCRVDMAAKRVLAGLLFVFDNVKVIGKKLLCHLYVEPAFVFLHQLLPASVPSIG